MDEKYDDIPQSKLVKQIKINNILQWDQVDKRQLGRENNKNELKNNHK